MSELEKLEQGMLVQHPNRLEWGPGKILDLQGRTAIIHFRDDSADYRTLLLDKVNLIIAEHQSDEMLDSLPPFIGGNFAARSNRVTVNQGIDDFKRRFPGGFSDPVYLQGAPNKPGGERNYKLKAHQYYSEVFGHGRGRALLAEGNFDKLRHFAQKVVTKGQLNLLSIYEQMAFKDGLANDDETAAQYFSALFDLTEQGPNRTYFDRLAKAVEHLPVKKGRARAATWPVMTIMPFLADPSRFMYLKPEPTKACAERLRFDLLYDSALRWATYERLLVMGKILLERLEPLGARDFIDVQSFMWIIEKY